MKGYRQLIKKHIESSLSEDHLERVVTIYETTWLRILLIRSLKHLDLVRLVVEVSFPNWLYDLPLILNNDDKPNETSATLQKVLKEMVIHLEYLRKLGDSGFRLELLVEEGIWSASTDLKETPSKKLFSILNPPLSNN